MEAWIQEIIEDSWKKFQKEYVGISFFLHLLVFNLLKI